MSSAIFGFLLLAAALLAMRFGRIITALVLTFLLGVTVAATPLGAPVRGVIDGVKVGISTATSAMFSGQKR